MLRRVRNCLIYYYYYYYYYYYMYACFHHNVNIPQGDATHRTAILSARRSCGLAQAPFFSQTENA